MNAGIFAVVIILATFIGLVVWDNVRIDEYQAQCATDGGRLIKFARANYLVCAKVEILYTEMPERSE